MSQHKTLRSTSASLLCSPKETQNLKLAYCLASPRLSTALETIEVASRYRSTQRPTHVVSELDVLVPGRVMHLVKHLSRTVCTTRTQQHSTSTEPPFSTTNPLLQSAQH